MRIVILGGTGFIGSALAKLLADHGDELVIPSRNPDAHAGRFGKSVEMKQWNAKEPDALAKIISGADGVVNLLGETISKRWTEPQKERILRSRLDAGEAVVQAFRGADARPTVLIQASAVGYYGPRGDELLDEDSDPGEGFLAEVAAAWENSTLAVEELGVRRAVIRTGVVLGRGGGVLEKFLPAFRFFAGGPLGSGKQWLSWIHLADEVGAIRHLLLSNDLAGPFNLAAPNPLTMNEFCIALGRAMRRPSWLRTPAFVLRALFGEMAEELLLSGQRVMPKKLLASGYSFHYPEVGQALADLLA